MRWNPRKLFGGVLLLVLCGLLTACGGYPYSADTGRADLTVRSSEETAEPVPFFSEEERTDFTEDTDRTEPTLQSGRFSEPTVSETESILLTEEVPASSKMTPPATSDTVPTSESTEPPETTTVTTRETVRKTTAAVPSEGTESTPEGTTEPETEAVTENTTTVTTGETVRETTVPLSSEGTESTTDGTTEPETVATETTAAIPSEGTGSEPDGTAEATTDEPFDILFWIRVAQDLAEEKGLELNDGACSCWDSPIPAGPRSRHLDRDINTRLDRYARDDDITEVWIWVESVGEDQYRIYIGYA